MRFESIIRQVESYYSGKIKEHGPSPKGVDWNSLESQQLRFRQLLKIVSDEKKKFSVLDYGCGYGAMYEFMKKTPAYSRGFNYTGYDISARMIEQARKRFSRSGSLWTTSLVENKRYDYVISSGIFNVKFGNSKKQWENYVNKTLAEINSLAEKGFSVNMLTLYSDREFMKDSLYYADPSSVLDYCKRNFSKYVAVLHDYPLYEFTVLVRKNI
jgi:SAM-dependent methyltransferase